MKYLILTLLFSTTVAAHSVSLNGYSDLTGDKCSVSYDSHGRELTNLKLSGDANEWGIMGNLDNPLSAYEKVKNVNIDLGENFSFFLSIFNGRSTTKSKSQKVSIDVDGPTNNPESVEVTVTNYARFIKTGVTTYKCIR